MNEGPITPQDAGRGRSQDREESIQPRPERRPRRKTGRSLFWPIILIGFGVILLLSNLGLVPATGLAILWRLWPVALIALGVDVLIGHRSVLGAIASGALALLLIGLAIGVVLLADQVPALVELARPAQLVFEEVEHPLDGIEEARVSIDWTSDPGFLSSLEDSDNLIEADIAYRGELAFDVDVSGDRADVSLDTYLQGISYGSLNFGDPEALWDVKLHPDPIYDLILDSGSGTYEYDLQGMKIRSLELDSGSGNVRLRLPAAGNITGVLDSGSGQVNLVVPEGMGVRIALDSGSGIFRPDDRFIQISAEDEGDPDGVWETENYARADHTLDLEIEQGSGAIYIRPTDE